MIFLYLKGYTCSREIFNPPEQSLFKVLFEILELMVSLQNYGYDDNVKVFTAPLKYFHNL